MEIIEALNIVSEYLDGEYIYEDDEGTWGKGECLDAMQFLVNQGLVQHLAEWHRVVIQGMIVDGNVDPNQDDPFTALVVTH